MPSTVIPALRYRDPRAAIDFLTSALGFEVRTVSEGADGGVDHAELTLGGGMVMLGGERDNEFGKLVRALPPRERPTSAMYLVVDDVAAHTERARAAGAEIVQEPEAQSYGGSNYTVRDPEGQIWTIGDYDLWAPSPG